MDIHVWARALRVGQSRQYCTQCGWVITETFKDGLQYAGHKLRMHSWYKIHVNYNVSLYFVAWFDYMQGI